MVCLSIHDVDCAFLKGQCHTIFECCFLAPNSFFEVRWENCDFCRIFDNMIAQQCMYDTPLFFTYIFLILQVRVSSFKLLLQSKVFCKNCHYINWCMLRAPPKILSMKKPAVKMKNWPLGVDVKKNLWSIHRKPPRYTNSGVWLFSPRIDHLDHRNACATVVRQCGHLHHSPC